MKPRSDSNYSTAIVLREPDTQIGLIFNIASMGQILSIPLIIIGVIFFKKS